MTVERDSVYGVLGGDSTSGVEKAAKGSNRRRFLGQVGSAAVAVAAGTLTTPSTASAQSAGSTDASVAIPPGVTNKRVIEAFNLRFREATQDALVPPAININNGDDAL